MSAPWRTNPDRSRFLGREGRPSTTASRTHAADARPGARGGASRALAEPGVPGFTIAHDARSAGLGLVYWWANENEIHARFYASPLDDPGALEPLHRRGHEPASGSSR